MGELEPLFSYLILVTDHTAIEIAVTNDEDVRITLIDWGVTSDAAL